MSNGIRWTVRDRDGNNIALTEERWRHIISSVNHPEMAAHESDLKETVKSGVRQQDSLNPRKYRYSETFDNLPANNTHIVAIVLFAETGRSEANDYVLTAYMKEVG